MCYSCIFWFLVSVKNKFQLTREKMREFNIFDERILSIEATQNSLEHGMAVRMRGHGHFRRKNKGAGTFLR